MGFTPSPVEAWYLAWIALVPLWLLLNPQQQWRNNLLIALAWGCGYYGLALFWITGIHPMTWMGVPWLISLLIALFCWLFITFWGAALVMVWAMLITLYQRFDSAIGRQILVGVTLWCLLESLWSHGALWWSSLAYSQSPHNLIILQLSKISGSNFVTAIIVGFNGLIAASIKGKKDFSLVHKFKLNNFSYFNFALLILLLSHLGGFFLDQQTILNQPNNSIKVGIIQGNIPNEIKLYPAGWRKAINGYTTGYINLAQEGVDLVLTPETALPFYWQDLVRNKDSFYRAILQQQVPVIVGAFGREKGGFHNSLFAVNSQGETLARYDKVKLVPLGEYIPFEQILGQIIDRLSPLDAHLLPGKSGQIFSTPFGKAIVGICYESAFAEHFRQQAAAGGEFILTASNNAHYSNTMPAQHHALDVMRAIETDRWAARATNTGYSAFVDPHGVTSWISNINEYEVKLATIYRRQTQTLYVRWGDWLTPLLSLLTILFIIMGKVAVHKKSIR